MSAIEVFVYLQVLDFVTTLIGMRMGGTEMSPFIRWLMQFDVVAGLSIAKGIGAVLGGVTLWLRPHVLVWVNYIFAVLVLWNIGNILRAVTPVQ